MKVFDNYEISPCKRFEEPDSPGKFYFEVCEPEEADVWTLYGHVSGEGVQAIGDFANREHAEETFQRITGIPFGGAREIAARLRVMHAGPNVLETLSSLNEALKLHRHWKREMPAHLISLIEAAVAEATRRAS